MHQLSLEEDPQYEYQHPVVQVDSEQMNPSSSNIPLPTITYPDSNTPASAYRVTTCTSPYVNVYINNHSPVRFTLDTGATVNMIHESAARQFGLHITPSTQTATQADGKSEIEIVGETRFTVSRDDKVLAFEGLVARKMDTEVLAGIPFLAANDISVHPAKKLVKIGETPYPYGSLSLIHI